MSLLTGATGATGASSPGVAEHLRLADAHAAQNYAPLPVVIAAAEGAWVTDVAGNRYLDCLSAYSAVNFGHRNERILAAARLPGPGPRALHPRERAVHCR
jgi:ornithine--oxo-acid transaminase